LETKGKPRRFGKCEGLGAGKQGRGDGVPFRAARPEGSGNRVVSIPADHPSACGGTPGEGRRGAEPLLLLCAPLLCGWFQPGGGNC
jgi:hypothetical protein